VVFRSIDALRVARVPISAVPEHLIVPGEARPALERLQSALGDFDVTAATSALADLDEVAAPGHDSELEQLRSHVDSYEYDEARVLATRLLEQIDQKVQ
jgi:hypothetical protein